jgi:hypothetical protein
VRAALAAMPLLLLAAACGSPPAERVAGWPVAMPAAGAGDGGGTGPGSGVAIPGDRLAPSSAAAIDPGGCDPRWTPWGTGATAPLPICPEDLAIGDPTRAAEPGVSGPGRAAAGSAR